MVSSKRKAVDLTTIYITKINIEKGSQSVPPAGSNVPAGAQWGSAPSNSISQSGDNVNNQGQKNNGGDVKFDLSRKKTAKNAK